MKPTKAKKVTVSRGEVRLVLGITTGVSGFSHAISISASGFFTYMLNNSTCGLTQFDCVFVYFEMTEILLECVLLSLCSYSTPLL